MGIKISYPYKKGYFVNFQLTLFSFVPDMVTEEVMGGVRCAHRGSNGRGVGVGTEEVRVGGMSAKC